MDNIIMTIGGVFFLVLFSFLLFVFVVYLISLFKKTVQEDFQPAVTIMIPAYNEEKNIKKCLDSVFGSGYPKEKMEVLVIDDGSTDKTREIASKYDITLLKQDHKGKSEAMNLATKHAKHDFLLTIDADSILEKDCITLMVRPLLDETIGATTGTSKVQNTNTIWAIFQNIEYHYNNLIRRSFTQVFKNGIWFFGALACYRKSVIEKIGYFKTDTLSEDMDIALEIHKAGHRTLHVHNAHCLTIVPETLKALYNQRKRWWMGVLQALIKNKNISKRNPSIAFLYINQFWWSIYALISLPLILYQVNYWLPYNTQSFSALFGYLFRWFSLAGPFYVLYKIPVWGINFYSVFGVLSGLISAILIIASIKMFKDNLSVKNLFALFFYFPYTIVLNIMITLSLLTHSYGKKRYFIR
ncbi:glycosyltransferase [Candidatus Woesearchaeota archaeon]|nr:glycosyltransferase [Candidatus Woesearchaeota archaeon]